MARLSKTIGPYNVLRPIAQGGMAEVFEVQDPSSGERLALKLLVETKASEKRFNREFEALTRLNHPGIVRVYRYGYHRENPWITMELLDGEPLQSRVKSFGPPGEPRRTAEVIRIGYFLAGALQYIHDRGLVHRDLKSANVQVLGDGRVKVIDFGTAHLSDPLEKITQEGDFVGTFSYAAPEQIVGTRVDHRADLYSLGVLLYRLTTGRRPFKAAEPRQVAQMHLKATARPPRQLVPELPEALERLILWLMEKKRADRPQSANVVARALEALARQPLTLPGLGIAVEPVKPVGREAEHLNLWNALEQRRTAGGVLVVGGDRRERESIALQVSRDATKRGWRGILCTAGDSPLRSIALACRAIAQGIDTPSAREIKGLFLDPRTIFPASLREILEQACPHVARVAGDHEEPTLLIVEEIERFGAEAVAVLQLLVVATLKERAVMPLIVTGASAQSPAIEAIRRVMYRPSAVELKPMDPRTTALAVAALVHRRPPPPEAARRIHEDAHGHPTLVRAIVRRMVDDGRVGVRGDDVNRVEWGVQTGGMDLPDDVKQELDDRMGQLPAMARRVLEVISVCGGRATPKIVSEVLGWHEIETEILLYGLREDGWIAGVTELEAVEPLVLTRVGEELGLVRRRYIGEAVVDLLPKDPPSLALVDLQLKLGRQEEALSTGVVCGEAMTAEGKTGATLRLLERLKPVASHPGLSKELRGSFHLLYGRTVRAVRPMDPASIRAFHSADQLAETADDKARVKFAYAELQGAIGHYRNYRTYLRESWESLTGRHDTALGAQVATRVADAQLQQGKLADAQGWYERALRAAQFSNSRQWLDGARIGLATISACKGGFEAAAQVFEDVVKAHEGEDGHDVTRWHALAGWADVMRRQGRYSTVLSRLPKAVVEARQGASPAAFVQLLMALATCELDLFRLGRAQECVDELMATIVQGEQLHLRVAFRLLHGRIQLASGQLGGANFMLQEVMEQAKLADLTVLAALGRAYLAETRWALGQRKESLDLYREALVELADAGDQRALVDVVVSRGRALGGREDPSRGFYLIRDLVERDDLGPLQVESLLAKYRWHRVQGHGQQASEYLAEASEALRGLASRQHPIEQAALRVHPWTREVQWAGS